MTNIEKAGSKNTDDPKKPDKAAKDYSSDIAALIDRQQKSDKPKSK